MRDLLDLSGLGSASFLELFFVDALSVSVGGLGGCLLGLFFFNCYL